jgi:hypothetical protein
MNLIHKVNAAIMEGIQLRNGKYIINMGRDNKYFDLVFIRKPALRDNVFCSFTVNSKVAKAADPKTKQPINKEALTSLKLVLKHLEIDRATGPWEEMLDYADKAFAQAMPILTYDVVVTAHSPGGGSPPLANVMVADLEDKVRSDTRIIRKGVAKSSLDQIHLDYELIDATTPKAYDAAKRAQYVRDVEKNFASSLKRAETEGRFQLRNMLPQWRKYVKGLFNASSDIKPGEKVLFVDDLYTTGSTLKQIRALLPENEVHGFMLLKG